MGSFSVVSTNSITVTTLLDVRGLKTTFATSAGLVRAVDGVSWDVNEGETVALVGESGCGKSVSALSIMRLIDPPSGPTSRGRCKRCGEERFFINSTADWVWDGQSAKDLAGPEAARPKAHGDWQDSA